jgi:hypothetical protein
MTDVYDIAQLKEIIQLLVDNKLDSIRFRDIEVHKTKHDPPVTAKPAKTPEQVEKDLDELLFFSTSAPQLSLDELSALTVTPITKA